MVGFEWQVKELRLGHGGQRHDKWPLGISSLQAEIVWFSQGLKKNTSI